MQDYDKQVFASNLKYYLTVADLTQIELANKLGVTRGAVSSWCSGAKMPRMDAIEKMAYIFGCQKSDLIEQHNFDLEPVYISPKRRKLLDLVETADDAEIEKMLQIVNLILGQREQ